MTQQQRLRRVQVLHLRDQSLSPGRVKNVHFSISSRPALGATQPPSQWVLRTLSSVAKRPGHVADHSHPTIAKVKEMWISTSTPPPPNMSSWCSA
jgi:hypothetical protein